MKDKQTDSTLGAIPSGKRETHLESKPTAASHKKSTRPKTEPLQLPRGAWLVFRRSGGLKFSSRQVVIYPDGRATRSGTDLPKQASASIKLNDAQMAELRRLVEQSGLANLKSSGGQQPPDSYAYEIIASGKDKPIFVEVFDGMIPASLMPLIQSLTKLLS
ncbi:MAG: hypothetical protein N2559_07265 [Anaerolineae bacterium]|nr:hypothetical protein [Anaerolineae bacterium]